MTEPQELSLHSGISWQQSDPLLPGLYCLSLSSQSASLDDKSATILQSPKLIHKVNSDLSLSKHPYLTFTESIKIFQNKQGFQPVS